MPTMVVPDEGSTYDIQSESSTANDHYEHWVINSCARSDMSSKEKGGFHARCILINLSIDCKKMLRPRASRKTPLKKAPSRVALCQPNE